MNRRRFLQTAVTASALTAACSKIGRQGRVLSEADLTTLEAICEQIVPADQDPGAKLAGVVNYIDRQLAGFYREHHQSYKSFVADADRRAGGSFAQAAADKQLEILNAMEEDDSTRAFFAVVVSHTMQGFYGNPRHGGNKDFCSWRMLGIPASPVRGRDQYDFTRGNLA